jgi:hypothetical protein
MSGTLVVRAMEIEGDIAKVAPHLATDPVIQQVERELNKYLVEPVDPADPQARRTFLARRMMKSVLHREATPPGPTASRFALLYPIRADRADIAERVLGESADPPLAARTVTLHNTSVFRQHDVIVRIMELDGQLPDVVELLSQATAVHDVGRHMARIFEGEYDFTQLDGLRQFFADNLMTTVTDRRAMPAGAGS